MSSKLEIQWSPIASKFITWGSEICLYQVHQGNDNSLQSIKLSSTTYASVLATNGNHHYVRCLDIYPKSECDVLLAVGLSNGRVCLTTFNPSEYDSLGLNGRELVPRHPRQCNSVCWNGLDTSILAMGLDKYRSDNSVLIWDVMKCPPNSEMSNNSRLTAMPTPAIELGKSTAPIAEFGVSETVHSMAWLTGSTKLLAIGMNQKNIKLYDIRDPNKLINSTTTRSVYGVSVDPNNEVHLASFLDNNVYVWDTRNFDKPILSLHHNRPVIKIGWCPTRYNLLSSLQKDSAIINLYDIQHTMSKSDGVEPSVLERDVAPGSQHNIMSFSWHHTDENRFLSIAVSGKSQNMRKTDRK